MAPNNLTATCKQWLKGTCQHGNQCHYSHQSALATPKIVASPASPASPRTPAEKKARRKFFKDRALLKNSGALLHAFDLSAIKKSTIPVGIKDSKFIASYNWCNSDEPIIFVPGAPAKWTPPPLPHRVLKDNGQAFTDQNKHRSPSASFDPFFKALLTMHSNFSMSPIALVTDRNSLRKLLNFVSGKVSQSWRIEVDVVEDTMFFTRWEESQVQIIAGAGNSGYGHEFEKAFLRFDDNLRGSSGHHRIVRYDLGGIECLVRFEVDGYIDDEIDSPSEDDELAQALSSLQVQTPKPASEVQVINRGRLVPPSTILELKSRSSGRSLQMKDFINQLWISQTPHLFVGWHKDGLVDVAPERVDLDEYFGAWEEKHQDYLRALVGLIKEIKVLTGKAKGGKGVLVCKMEERPRVLRMYQRNGEGIFLPKGAREKCWKPGNQEGSGQSPG